MRELDRLTRALAEVQDQLLALGPDQFAERYELQKRQDTLRAEAATFDYDWDTERSSADLEAEIAELRRYVEQLIASKSGLLAAKGGNMGSAISGAFAKLAFDAKLTVLDEVGRAMARLDHLKAVLGARRNAE